MYHITFYTRFELFCLIHPSHLPNYIRNPIPKAIDANDFRAVKSLNELEREAILQTAKACNGNVSEMARLLGIGRTTLWRRLRAYNILPDDYRGNDKNN